MFISSDNYGYCGQLTLFFLLISSILKLIMGLIFNDPEKTPTSVHEMKCWIFKILEKQKRSNFELSEKKIYDLGGERWEEATG